MPQDVPVTTLGVLFASMVATGITDLLLRIRRQELKAVLMLSSLRAIRKLDIPVDRMERVPCMPCNGSFFSFVRTFDSNENSPSYHLP